MRRGVDNVAIYIYTYEFISLLSFVFVPSVHPSIAAYLYSNAHTLTE